MTAYLQCWTDAATALFSQALAGEPNLVEAPVAPCAEGAFAFAATLGGDQQGTFAVVVDGAALATPLMGEGVDQKAAWGELLREVAEAAAGDFLVRTGRKCRVESFSEVAVPDAGDAARGFERSFELKGPERTWTILVLDGVADSHNAGLNPEEHARPAAAEPIESRRPGVSSAPAAREQSSDGLDLLMDVELEATLRFGCRELPLGEVLDLGPGDVVQLDRTVRDPVDLIVGDKIVARGEVVLINGNFGLRVMEVATPRKRLESIRCLF